MVVPSTSEAVEASLACARSLGLPADDPLVVAEGYSVRVLLRPAPVLTRVVTVGRRLRDDPGPWMRRELDVATWLAGQGAPVCPPWGDPGPFRANGLEVSLWRWLVPQPATIGQADFGCLLGDLHEALAGYPGDALPHLVGPLTDIGRALERSDDDVLHAVAAELLSTAATWPSRPLHGDAHTGNVLLTADGPRWLDFEDVCAGPPEWYLASRTITPAAVAAYPGPLDPDRLRQCRRLRTLQIYAAGLFDDLHGSELQDRLRSELRSSGPLR